MANMSYCRFRNTLIDLRDCINALYDRNIESNEEKEKAKIMLEEIARFLIDEYLVDVDKDCEVFINYQYIDELIAECE